jgi:hypothetical protein
MRLSNTQKILIHFFLITCVTLLLKSNANAQAIRADNVFAYNDYRHARSEDDHIYIGADISKHDEESTDEQIVFTINFHQASESLTPLSYRLIKNNRKAYLAHSSIPMMAYSIDLKHSARLTFKVFKLVIVPLWQSK